MDTGPLVVYSLEAIGHTYMRVILIYHKAGVCIISDIPIETIGNPIIKTQQRSIALGVSFPSGCLIPLWVSQQSYRKLNMP